jgi:hypothetical protein
MVCYYVKSTTTDRSYRVTLDPERTCECRGYSYGKNCVHLRYARWRVANHLSTSSNLGRPDRRLIEHVR